MISSQPVISQRLIELKGGAGDPVKCICGREMILKHQEEVRCPNCHRLNSAYGNMHRCSTMCRRISEGFEDRWRNTVEELTGRMITDEMLETYLMATQAAVDELKGKTITFTSKLGHHYDVSGEIQKGDIKTVTSDPHTVNHLAEMIGEIDHTDCVTTISGHNPVAVLEVA